MEIELLTGLIAGINGIIFGSIWLYGQSISKASTHTIEDMLRRYGAQETNIQGQHDITWHGVPGSWAFEPKDTLHLVADLTKIVPKDVRIDVESGGGPLWDQDIEPTRGNVLLMDESTRTGLDALRNIEKLPVSVSLLDGILSLSATLCIPRSRSHIEILMTAQDMRHILTAFERCLHSALRTKDPQAEAIARRARHDGHSAWSTRILRLLFQEHLETEPGREALAWALAHKSAAKREIACAYASDDQALPVWRTHQQDQMSLGALRVRELAATLAGAPLPPAYAPLLDKYGSSLLWRDDIPEEARDALLTQHLKTDTAQRVTALVEKLPTHAAHLRAFFLKSLRRRDITVESGPLLELISRATLHDMAPLMAHMQARAPDLDALVHAAETTTNPTALRVLGAHFEEHGGPRAIRALMLGLNGISDATQRDAIERHIHAIQARLGENARGALSLSLDGVQGGLSVSTGSQGGVSLVDSDLD